MNLNVKTKIRFNGQEYSSPVELPAEVRSAYEKAIAGQANTIVKTGITTRLVVNGKEFSSPGEMPEAERKVYQDAMQLIHDETAAAPQPVPDHRWLTKRQVVLVLIVAAVSIAAALIIGAKL